MFMLTTHLLVLLNKHTTWHHSSKPQLALTHFCLPVSFLGMNLLFVPWPSYHSYTNYHWWNILIFNNLVILNLDSHNGLRCQVCCCQLHEKEGNPSIVSTKRPLCLQQTETALLPPPLLYTLWRTLNPCTATSTAQPRVIRVPKKRWKGRTGFSGMCTREKELWENKAAIRKSTRADYEPRHHGGASRSWTWECRPV